MKLVYSSENRLLVGNVQNLLENAGIDVFLKNEHAASAMGELSAFDTWPELWLRNESDYPKAMAIIAPLQNDTALPPWHCSECQEVNEASFELCWQCQHEKPLTC